jgi:molybdenum cofactor synthesis domain-containing protein
MNQEKSIFTSALLIIGDEILSGRTQDTNTQFLAKGLNARGIRLSEVRVVPDDKARIIEALNTLRALYSYVFTTGGIGPTHDDITAECIADAFGVPLVQNPEAMKMLEAHYHAKGEIVTPPRAKMALIPEGAALILNGVSGAPGFIIGNVYVMAGVPRIMQSMYMAIENDLKGGAVMLSRQMDAGLPESKFAEALGELQKKYRDISMGSYPTVHEGVWSAIIVLRGTDEARLDEVFRELEQMLQGLKIPVHPQP